MATVQLDSDRSVSVGRVLSRGFGTLGSNPLVTFGIAALLTGVPAQLFGLAIRDANVGALQRSGGWGVAGIGLLSVVVSIVLSVVTQGALVRATIAHSEGRRAGIGESLTAGLSVALPLIGLAIVSSLGIGLGFILLFVPGVMLYVMWSVSGPALVEERLGPFEALGRSRSLTSGARWKIFALMLVLLIMYWLLSAVVGVILVMLAGGVQQMTVNSLNGAVSWPVLVLGLITQTLSAAVWGVMQASLYVEVRDWKDGPTGDRVADVFR
jgi:hypothetical protein